MFGRKSKLTDWPELEEQLNQKVQALQETLLREFQSLRETNEQVIHNLCQTTENQTEALRQAAADQAEAIRGVKQELSRHGMVIEDMLEGWDEFQDQQAEVARSLDNRKDLSEERDALVGLCGQYEDQLLLLRRAFDREEEWKKQLNLMEAAIEPARIKAGFMRIGCPGEPVDYSLHEVIAVTDTGEAEKNGLIECVYDPGYAYRGEVRKKARVSAYRYPSPDQESPAQQVIGEK